MNTKDSSRIQSLDRGLQILLAVGGSKKEMSLPELTGIMKMDRSSVFRLANTLRLRGLLRQSASTKAYSLGPAIWQLASQMRHSSSLLSVSREYVKSLADATGETTHLATREGKSLVFLDYALTSQAIGVSFDSGRVEPLYCTALGKSLLIDCSEAELVDILGKGKLRQFTLKTITSVRILANDCEKSRQRGYTIDDAEFRDEVRCVAAPIRGFDGKIVAAIGISAPASRLTRNLCAKVAAHVMDTAQQISGELGFVTDTVIHS